MALLFLCPAAHLKFSHCQDIFSLLMSAGTEHAETRSYAEQVLTSRPTRGTREDQLFHGHGGDILCGAGVTLRSTHSTVAEDRGRSLQPHSTWEYESEL